jgi:hypothetical protein
MFGRRPREDETDDYACNPDWAYPTPGPPLQIKSREEIQLAHLRSISNILESERQNRLAAILEDAAGSSLLSESSPEAMALRESYLTEAREF